MTRKFQVRRHIISALTIIGESIFTNNLPFFSCLLSKKRSEVMTLLFEPIQGTGKWVIYQR